MSERQPSQPVIVIASTKSTGLAIILALLFGPLGLLYSSVLAAVVMLIASLLAILFTAGLGLLLTQPIGAIWAALAVMSHNKKIVGGVNSSLAAARPRAVVQDVVVSSSVPTELPRAVQPLPHLSKDSMFCEVCGLEGTEGFKFCGECGGQLRPAPKDIETSPEEAEVVNSLPSAGTATGTSQGPLREGSGTTIALLAAALIVLAVAGYWGMHSRGNRDYFVGTWQYGSENSHDASGHYDPIGYLRVVKTNSSRYQLVEGFPCNDGAICWREDVCGLSPTNGKLEGTIRSYNFRATHAVVFDYHLEVESVDENNVLYRVDPGFNPETHKAHRINLSAQSVTPSEVVPTTGSSATATPNPTESIKESKRFNVEGFRVLSGTQPDFNDAKRDFEQAVQLDSNNIEALNNLGYVYGRLGDYNSAEPILIKVIDQAPTRKVAYGNLGLVQAKLGKTQEAANHFCQFVHQFNSLERGRSILAKTFNDPDPNVQSAVNSTLANCN
jgi:hypothetical protein